MVILMRLRRTLTKSSAMDGGVKVERDFHFALYPSKAEDIIHLVPRRNWIEGRLIAYCGFDCTGRRAKPKHSANCVVCLDLKANEAM